jgi:hypothetical protein
MPGLGSTPTSRPVGPMSFSASRATRPVPMPTSSTCAPGARPARFSNAAAAVPGARAEGQHALDAVVVGGGVVEDATQESLVLVFVL